MSASIYDQAENMASQTVYECGNGCGRRIVVQMEAPPRVVMAEHWRFSGWVCVECAAPDTLP